MIRNKFETVAEKISNAVAVVAVAKVATEEKSALFPSQTQVFHIGNAVGGVRKFRLNIGDNFFGQGFQEFSAVILKDLIRVNGTFAKRFFLCVGQEVIEESASSREIFFQKLRL